MSVVVTLCTILSLVGIGVGSFLRNDGYQGHDAAGTISEVIGWIGFGLSGVIDLQLAADEQVRCTIFGDCVEPTVRRFVWDRWLAPIFVGVILGGLAHGIGWFIALLTKRAPNRQA